MPGTLHLFPCREGATFLEVKNLFNHTKWGNNNKKWTRFDLGTYLIVACKRLRNRIHDAMNTVKPLRRGQFGSNNKNKAILSLIERLFLGGHKCRISSSKGTFGLF